jgi:hypothetical protein
MSVCCECCVLSGRGFCDELIARPEESYRLWCVVVCDIDTSWMRRPWPTGGYCARNKQTKSFPTTKRVVMIHLRPMTWTNKQTNKQNSCIAYAAIHLIAPGKTTYLARSAAPYSVGLRREFVTWR